HDLLRAGRDLEVLIAGEGEDRPRLQGLVDELGLRDRVRLLGYCGDTRAVYEALDVFVLSSLREGLPNVLLEAMALEVPVPAPRIAGVPRLIRDGANGLLVPAGSADDLTRALARLCADAGLRAELGRAGRETVGTRYSFAARMQKVGALYDQLLSRN